MSKSSTQIRADVTLEQKNWLETTYRNVSQGIRDIISRAMPGGDLNEDGPDRRNKQVRFLEAVEKNYRFAKSCEVANVDQGEMSDQLEADADFAGAFKAAQGRFTEDVEYMVIEAARGDRKIDKSAMTGLIAWLNNNHPAWGRVKAEMIQRIFAPLFSALLGAVKDEVDAKTYRRLVTRFEAIREQRFLAFSD